VKIAMMALLTGIVTGSIFTWAKLPLPAPPTLAGIAGIIGIFLGSKITDYIIKLFT
jgi:XapX domain-containing protein